MPHPPAPRRLKESAHSRRNTRKTVTVEIHNITGATGPEDFTDWVRYAFPEVVLSDREIRDDTDIPRRVNHAVLKGLRNDIEIYRCRGLIDQTRTTNATWLR